MNRARLFSGSVLLVVGVVALLGAADVLDAGALLGAWWPLVVVAAGVVMWWSNRRRWLAPALVVLVGALLLVETADLVEGDVWQLLWPLILVAVGMRLLTRPSGSRTPTAAGDRVDTFVAFGGTEVAPSSHRFTGGTVGAIFGSADVDLRGTEPAPGAELDVFAAFGGADVRVPEGWRVNVHGLPLFGGIDNVTAHEALPDNAPRLDVHATVLFGGVDVKH